MTINVTKYRLNPDRIFAGTRGSFGMEKLSFDFGDGWDFDTISVTFHPQRGKPIKLPILPGTEIDIPAEVMEHSGESRFVVSGRAVGEDGTIERQAITLEGYVDVAYTADEKGGNTRKVTPDMYDHLIDQASKIFDEAREDVERTAAEASWFASGAEGFANSAEEDADSAEKSASAAKTAEQAASKSAGEAKTAADTATGAASNAAQSADDATSAASAAKASETAAENSRKSVEQIAEGIPETVQETLQQAKDSGEFDGADGHSPTAKAERVKNGVRVTITDKDGTTSEVVQDGKSGVHVGSAAPPAGTQVWVNPDGERTKIPQIDDTLTKAGYAADAAKVGEKINQLSGEIADVSGTKKAHEYSGERIMLNRYTFDYSELFNTVSNGVGMQDGCAYGDYYFQFTPNGRFGVYDLRDNSFVGAFDLDQNETIVSHCNSASFSSMFYQPEDLFPLVYINAYNNTDLPRGTCYVHRILKDGNTFSTQLVQIIRIGFTDSDMWLSVENETRPYGNFVVDAKNKHLYAYTTRDGDKTTRFFKFDLPNVGLIGQSAFSTLDYDASKATNDRSLDASTGLTASSATYWITDYIYVGDSVCVNVNVQAYRVYYYDAAQTYIGYRSVEQNYNDVDLFDGTAYIRIMFAKDKIVFEQASSVTVRGLPHMESSLGYNPSNAADGKGISGTSITDNTSYWITGNIATNGYSSCWFNFKPYKVAFLNDQYVIVKSEYPTSNTVTIPAGTTYIVAQYSNRASTPFETAQSLVVLEAEPVGEVEMEIVLSENDILEHFDVDYFAIPQGCECHNGRLYVTSGWGDASTGSFLHVVDPKTKREVSTIDFYGLLDGEPEAVAVVNNRLLYGAGGTMYELLV